MSEPRKVDDNDYNRLHNTVNSILGVGNSNRGYGQQLDSQPAEQGSLITATQWNRLSNDISDTVIHQTGAFPTLPTYSKNRSITLADVDQLESLVTVLDTNRFNVGTGRTEVTTVASKSSNQTWTTRATAVLTVTFSNSNQARYFFNSGGKIRFSSSRSGGTSSLQNSAWTSMLAAIGNLEFTGNSSQLLNYYNLTNGYQIWFQQNTSTPYSSNYFRIEAASDAPSNIAGVASILYFKFTWEDLYPGVSDKVDGTLKIDVSQVKAIGPLRNGRFRIESPTYELTNINYVGSPAKSYFLTTSKNSANSANDTYTVILNTFNVPDGEVVPYTITGINSSDINGESLTGSFTVFNNTASKVFYTTSRDYIAIPQPVPVPIPQPVPIPYVPPPVRPEPPPPKQLRTREYTTVGSGTFIVPNNVYSLTVTLIGGGAGGSSGSEGDPWVTGGGGGASGGYKKQTISCSPGQRIEYIVGIGGGGAPRTTGGSVRVGDAGGLTKFGSIFTAGGTPASSVYTSHFHVGGLSPMGGINGSDGQIVRSSTGSNLVRCRGGNGGGIAGFGVGGQGGDSGDPVSFEVNSRQIPGAQAVTHPAWNSTMNQYAVWAPALSLQTVSAPTVVYFPFTGSYTFYLQADNTGYIDLDGTRVLSAVDNFAGAPVQINRNVTVGNHTITVGGSNYGNYNASSNPAGVAALITGQGRSPQANDGNGYNGSGYGAGGGGGFGQSGGSPPQGGGGNGTSGYIKVEWEE